MRDEPDYQLYRLLLELVEALQKKIDDPEALKDELDRLRYRIKAVMPLAGR
jgi:hypothetical protein